MVGIFVLEGGKNSVQPASGMWFTTNNVQGSLRIQLYRIVQEVIRYKTLVGILSLNVWRIQFNRQAGSDSSHTTFKDIRHWSVSGPWTCLRIQFNRPAGSDSEKKQRSRKSTNSALPVIRDKTVVGILVLECVKNSVQPASRKWFRTTFDKENFL